MLRFTPVKAGLHRLEKVTAAGISELGYAIRSKSQWEWRIYSPVYSKPESGRVDRLTQAKRQMRLSVGEE